MTSHCHSADVAQALLPAASTLLRTFLGFLCSSRPLLEASRSAEIRHVRYCEVSFFSLSYQ
jgi:hypothetical protein